MTGVTAPHPRVSFADLEQWPDDGRRYELYDGEVYVVPSPLPLHQVVAARLYDVLHDSVHSPLLPTLSLRPIDVVPDHAA